MHFTGDPDSVNSNFFMEETCQRTNAIAIKLPTFWAQQPEVWFFASWSTVSHPQDTTKYYHVVAALDQETSGHVLDALTAPPAGNKYTDLKQSLLTTFSLS